MGFGGRDFYYYQPSHIFKTNQFLIGRGSNCLAAKYLYLFAQMNLQCFPFQMNTEAKRSTTSPIAPIVLKTLAIPTELTHGTMAKTNIVLKVFLTKVRATSASPTICLDSVSQLQRYTATTYLIVCVNNVCQRDT